MSIPQLPHELYPKILSYWPQNELHNLVQICHEWYNYRIGVVKDDTKKVIALVISTLQLRAISIIDANALNSKIASAKSLHQIRELRHDLFVELRVLSVPTVIALHKNLIVQPIGNPLRKELCLLNFHKLDDKKILITLTMILELESNSSAIIGKLLKENAISEAMDLFSTISMKNSRIRICHHLIINWIQDPEHSPPVKIETGCLLFKTMDTLNSSMFYVMIDEFSDKFFSQVNISTLFEIAKAYFTNHPNKNIFFYQFCEALSHSHVDVASEAVKLISIDYLKELGCEGLTNIARFCVKLPKPNIDKAMEAANAIEDELYRGKLFCQLARTCLRNNALTEARTLSLFIPQEGDKNDLLLETVVKCIDFGFLDTARDIVALMTTTDAIEKAQSLICRGSC